MSKRYTGFLPTPKAGNDYRDTKMSPSSKAGKHGKSIAGVLADTVSPPSISSAAVHLASLHLSPGSEEAQRMTVGSGERLLGLYGNCNLLGACSRTLLGYLVSTTAFRSRLCFLTWKVKATRFNRLLFQLAPSVPRTGETGYGLLLKTPTAEDCADREFARNNRGEPKLSAQIKMLGTPTSHERTHSPRQVDHGIQLANQIAMLPTPTDSMATMQDMMQAKYHSSKRPKYQDAILPAPTSRDFRSEKCSDETYEKNARPLSETLGKNTGMKLQPAFVEWMMGFPEGWTELTD